MRDGGTFGLSTNPREREELILLIGVGKKKVFGKLRGTFFSNEDNYC